LIIPSVYSLVESAREATLGPTPAAAVGAKPEGLLT